MGDYIWEMLWHGPVVLALFSVAMYLLTTKREPHRPLRLAGCTFLAVIVVNLMLFGFRQWYNWVIMDVFVNGNTDSAFSTWTIAEFNTLYRTMYVFSGLLHAIGIVIIGLCVAAGRPKQAADEDA